MIKPTNKRRLLVPRIGKIQTLALTALMVGSFDAESRQCNIRISTQEDHSGLAQQVTSRVNHAVDTSALLAMAIDEEPYDIEFLLVSASPEARAHPETSVPFKLFYLVLGEKETVIVAEALRCPDGPDDCVVFVMKQIGEACGALSGTRFTRKPRGSAQFRR